MFTGCLRFSDEPFNVRPQSGHLPLIGVTTFAQRGFGQKVAGHASGSALKCASIAA
jgi:hypothetical protein